MFGGANHEMKAEHRSRLLAIAAERGQKGFSNVLAEAIESNLKGQRDREMRAPHLLTLAGTLSEEEAADLRREILAVRGPILRDGTILDGGDLDHA
jgi:hypothetical protein